MKTQEYLSNKFYKVVKGANWMTPKLLEFYPIKNGVVELSTGSKFCDSTPFGVTVVKNNVHDTDLGRCLWSLDEALNYIKSLQ